MALNVIDDWFCGGQNYQLAFNDVTNQVEYLGPNVITLTQQCVDARAKILNEVLYTFCDGTDEVEIRVSFDFPFYIEVRTPNGCTACDLAITNTTKNDPSGPTTTDGSIELTATTGNTPRYDLSKLINGIYQVVEPVTDFVSGVPVIIAGLDAGDYRVRVTESSGVCKTQLRFFVLVSGAGCGLSFSNATVTDETSENAEDGTAIINAIGGTGVEYSLTNLPGSYQSSNSFTGLAPGNYTVYLRESADNSCAAIGTFIIDAFNQTEPLPTRITEKKTIKVRHDCGDHPIMLMWLNSLGGWDFWLFEFDHRNQYRSAKGTEFTRPIEEISTQEIIIETFRKTKSRRIRVGSENLETQEIEAIADIVDSRQVYWIRPVPGGFKQVGVKVITNNIEWNARNKMHPVRIEIELPPTFAIQ